MLISQLNCALIVFYATLSSLHYHYQIHRINQLRIYCCGWSGFRLRTNSYIYSITRPRGESQTVMLILLLLYKKRTTALRISVDCSSFNVNFLIIYDDSHYISIDWLVDGVFPRLSVSPLANQPTYWLPHFFCLVVHVKQFPSHTIHNSATMMYGYE